MAKRIFDQYRDVSQLLGQTRVRLTPGEFTDALYFASRALYDYYYGQTEQYRRGAPVPAVAYQQTQAVTEALLPFRREVRWGRDPVQLAAGTVPTGLTGQTARYLKLEPGGQLALPTDWGHPTAWSAPGAVEGVQVLDDAEVQGMLNSRICPPTPREPMVGTQQGGYQLYGGAAELRCQYLAAPRRPIYWLDYDPNDPEADPTYNDARSVDVEWPPLRDNQLYMHLLQYPALLLRDPLVQNVAQTLKERGT